MITPPLSLFLESEQTVPLLQGIWTRGSYFSGDLQPETAPAFANGAVNPIMCCVCKNICMEMLVREAFLMFVVNRWLISVFAYSNVC